VEAAVGYSEVLVVEVCPKPIGGDERGQRRHPNSTRASVFQ
jgi:hypothetical protein